MLKEGTVARGASGLICELGAALVQVNGPSHQFARMKIAGSPDLPQI
jgi:hypothetical protein